MGYSLIQGGVRHLGYWELGAGLVVALFDFGGAAADGRITGIDAQERHVQQARTRIAAAKLPRGSHVTARLGDYHDLGWIPDKSLDGIYTSEQQQLPKLPPPVTKHCTVRCQVVFANHLLVSQVEALVHATDLARVLANLHRVLKPGGRLVLLEYQWK